MMRIPDLKGGMEPSDYWRDLTERARAAQEESEMDPFLALDFWANWLAERPRQHYDAVVVITGDEGTGKSTLALRLILKTNAILGNAWRPTEVCYSALDLIRAYKNVTEKKLAGWPVWYDEGVRGSSAYDNPLSPESRAIVKALALVRESGAILFALYPSIWLANKQIRARRACLWIHVVRRGLGRVHERDRRLNYLPTEALGLTISARAPHVAWEPFAEDSDIWTSYVTTKNAKLREFLTETEADLEGRAKGADRPKLTPEIRRARGRERTRRWRERKGLTPEPERGTNEPKLA